MTQDVTARLRIGLGWDRHRLVEGKPFVLGGIEIPHQRGPHGHSDGDALLHAACDAVLGASGDDDLGTLFPDSAVEHHAAPSSTFATAVSARLAARGYRMLSLDAVIVVDAPKLAPHRNAVRESLANLFHLPTDAVNVKAKTREGIGPDGVVEATVVALVERTDSPSVKKRGQV